MQDIVGRIFAKELTLIDNVIARDYPSFKKLNQGVQELR